MIVGSSGCLTLSDWARTSTSRLVGRGSPEALAVTQEPIDDRVPRAGRPSTECREKIAPWSTEVREVFYKVRWLK